MLRENTEKLEDNTELREQARKLAEETLYSGEEVRELCYKAFIHHKCVDGKIKPYDAMDLIEPFKEWCKEYNL